MRKSLALFRRDPVLRLALAGAFLFGSYVSSIGPYQSLVAVELFGMSEGAYALVLIGALLVGVAAAIVVGIVTDQHPLRREMAILATVCAIVAPLAVWIAPGKTTFVLAHVAIMPVAGTLFGQIFAMARLASRDFDETGRNAVVAVLRALFALPFVVVLPIWGMAADWSGMSLVTIYPGITLMAAVHLVLILRLWPRDADLPWTETKSGIGLRESLSEIMSPAVLLRVQVLGAVQAGGAVVGIIAGLAFAEAGRGTGPVGLFFALFVAFEVAGTLLMAGRDLRLPRLWLIGIGAAMYAAFVALLPFVAGGPWVWVVIIPGGLGGALMYTLAIAYLQDLMASRPGAGGSLMAVQRIATDSVAAGSFWIGTAVSGLGLAAVIGAGATLVAMAALLILDRRTDLR